MKSFIKKVSKFWILAIFQAMICAGSVWAVSSVVHIEGMYRSSLNQDMYSPFWERYESDDGIVTRGTFRGHEISVTLDHNGRFYLSASDEMLELITDFIHDRNLGKYNLSEDEKAYLAISLFRAISF